MQRHTRNYLKAANALPHEIMCELCGNNTVAVEIHHINHRQKNNPELDEAHNLLALCRRCHVYVHENNTFEYKQQLLEIARKRSW